MTKLSPDLFQILSVQEDTKLSRFSIQHLAGCKTSARNGGMANSVLYACKRGSDQDFQPITSHFCVKNWKTSSCFQGSLVPRPSHRPVFDRLQCAKKEEGEAWYN